MWARKFEPPAISGRESEDAMGTLLFLFEETGDQKYLAPIEPAIAWIKRSLLADGQIARFYEMQTNRPLYFVRDTYELTYEDDNLPTHYSFKAKSQVEKIEKRFHELKQSGKFSKSVSNLKTLTRDAERIISELDSEGRWLSDDKGKPVTAATHLKGESKVISSELFSRNMQRLAEYFSAARDGK